MQAQNINCPLSSVILQGINMSLKEAVYTQGYQFVREVDWDENVDVYSALVTNSSLLANCKDYISYYDQIEVRPLL